MTQLHTRATIADVASKAGVSKATVSRFLNHRDALLSPEIALKVEIAIAELGYVPSPMAQALKRGRSKLIGLIMADITNPYSVAVLRGAEQACREAGYLVMLFNLGNDSQQESAGIQALSSYRVEGFMLNAMSQDVSAALETARQGKPMVLIDRLYNGLNVDFVSLDNPQAIGLCTEHLLQSGYGELLLVTEPVGNVSSRIERTQAFRLCMQQHSLAQAGRLFESAPENPEALVAALLALRERAQAQGRLPAVLSGNGVVTLRVVAALAQLGWRLGKDIGLVGIDDTEWAPYVGPGISTVSQPTNELGRKAAICLMQRVSGLNIPARRTLLPGALVVRGSSRP